MSIIIKEFFDQDTATFTYIITDVSTKISAIIDPITNFNQFSGLVSYTSADMLINYVTDNNLKVAWILETHIHADHITAANYLRAKLGAKIGIGSKITQVFM